MEPTIQTEYFLTDDEKGMIVPLLEYMQNANREANAIIAAICRLRKLPGNWQLDNERLIRTDINRLEPVPQSNGLAHREE